MPQARRKSGGGETIVQRLAKAVVRSSLGICHGKSFRHHRATSSVLTRLVEGSALRFMLQRVDQLVVSHYGLRAGASAGEPLRAPLSGASRLKLKTRGKAFIPACGEGYNRVTRPFGWFS